VEKDRYDNDKDIIVSLTRDDYEPENKNARFFKRKTKE
jgi:hypothetical protein